jgi:hypothetical protein
MVLTNIWQEIQPFSPTKLPELKLKQNMDEKTHNPTEWHGPLMITEQNTADQLYLEAWQNSTTGPGFQDW